MSMALHAKIQEGEYDSQKQNAPTERRTTARVTKTGPAAPVTRSPKRSSALKQRKTSRVHHRGIPAGLSKSKVECART